MPFFLQEGPQLATGDGTTLEPIELPRDYAVLLALPNGATKELDARPSTARSTPGTARGASTSARAALRAALAARPRAV